MWLVVSELFVEILQLLVNHNAIVSVEILLLGRLDSYLFVNDSGWRCILSRIAVSR